MPRSGETSSEAGMDRNCKEDRAGVSGPTRSRKESYIAIGIVVQPQNYMFFGHMQEFSTRSELFDATE